MAQQGKADQALTAAAVASFIGGTISVILFTLFAPPLAVFALKFGPQEEFALMVLAFATFIGLGGDDIPKTIFSILLGLVMAAVGFDNHLRPAATDLLRLRGTSARYSASSCLPSASTA